MESDPMAALPNNECMTQRDSMSVPRRKGGHRIWVLEVELPIFLVGSARCISTSLCSWGVVRIVMPVGARSRLKASSLMVLNLTFFIQGVSSNLEITD